MSQQVPVKVQPPADKMNSYNYPMPMGPDRFHHDPDETRNVAPLLDQAKALLASLLERCPRIESLDQNT